MYSKSLELDLDTALESLDNILMTDDEKYASMEAYLDELVSHDSYDEVNTLFESVYEYDTVMEEDNGSNKKGIIEKIKKAIAWLKKKFFDIVSSISSFLKKIWDKLKSLFKRKKKTRKERISELEKSIHLMYDMLASANKRAAKAEDDARTAQAELYAERIKNAVEKKTNEESKENIANVAREYKNKYNKAEADKQNLQSELEKEQDRNENLKYENEDLKKEIRKLQEQIDFLKGSGFENKFVERVYKNMSDSQLHMLYWAMSNPAKIENNIQGLLRAIERIGENHNNDSDLASDLLTNARSNLRDLKEILSELNESISQAVKNNIERYLTNEKKLFDDSGIKVISNIAKKFEAEKSSAVNILKKNLVELDEKMKKLSPNDSNSEEYEELNRQIRSTNNILTMLAESSSSILQFCNGTVSSVATVRNIYSDLLSGNRKENNDK